MPEENLKSADLFAESYDEVVVKTHWPGPQILFNLSKDFITKGETLLDLGTGTGAGVLPFFEAGLKITGVDGSKNMLEICRRKKIASRLAHHNLENSPLPFVSNEFGFVLSHAVFHLVHPIEPTFSEVSRILKPVGYFCFTFDEAVQTDGYSEFEPGIWRARTQTGVCTFKHDKNYIADLLNTNYFAVLKEERYLAYSNPELKKDFYLTALLTQKIIIRG